MSLLQIGDKIDNYRIERCLGVGGMGEVYLATHLILKVQRALKLPYPDLLERDPMFRERLTREGHIAAYFQHPNSIEVVNVEDESDSGFLYLVMEYVDGRTLREYLNEGVMDAKQTLLTCREVARALDAAWREMRLVHRDIKPANIMIASDGTVKLADLGVAKALQGENETAQALTMEGSMIGTPDYASPEQIIDASKVDTRADIYSIGATMYTMLTGVRPFSGANTFETMRKVLHDPLKPVREWNPGVPAEIAALVERMMSKDPARRPQTMQELIEILDQMLSDQEEPEVFTVLPELHPPTEKKEPLLSAALKFKAKPASHWTIDFFCIILFFTVMALAFLYLSNKNFYGKKEQKFLRLESKRLSEARQQYRYFGSNKNDTPRYVRGVRYIHNGTCLAETTEFNQFFTSVTVLDSARTFLPNALQNCKNIDRITLPAALLESFAARIHEFPNLNTITVHYYRDMPVPDVKLPSHIYLRKLFMTRSRIYISPKKDVKPEPETKQITVVQPEPEKAPSAAVHPEPKKTPSAAVHPEPKKTPSAAVHPEPKKKNAGTVALLKFVLDAAKKQQTENEKDVVSDKKMTPNVSDLNSPAYAEARKAGVKFSPDGRILRQATNRHIRECRIPEGVEYIAPFAFSNCIELKTVTFPSTLKNLGVNAFRNCFELRSVVLPEGLKRINSDLFNNCNKLEHVKLPESLEYCGETFRGTAVKELYIPKNLRYIVGAIADTGILKISPENPYLKLDRYGVLYKIEKNFVMLLSARSKKLPLDRYSVIRGTNAIAVNAFSGIPIYRVTLPESVNWIGRSAFANCTRLQRVDMPAGLNMISSYAFSKCSNLTIEIPARVREIGESAFAHVKKVTIAKGNRNFYKDRAGAFYEKKTRKLIYYPTNNLQRYYTVLRGTEIIGKRVFAECPNLYGVVLPDSLKKIEQRAFYKCSNLMQINIPPFVKKIEEYAFSYCPKLGKVVVPAKTDFSSSAFDYNTTVQRNP